jgi:hypothetical protein
MDEGMEMAMEGWKVVYGRIGQMKGGNQNGEWG